MWTAKVGEERRRVDVEEGVRMQNWMVGGWSETDVNEEHVMPRASDALEGRVAVTTTTGKVGLINEDSMGRERPDGAIPPPVQSTSNLAKELCALWTVMCAEGVLRRIVIQPYVQVVWKAGQPLLPLLCRGLKM